MIAHGDRCRRPVFSDVLTSALGEVLRGGQEDAERGGGTYLRTLRPVT
jgi:hypothetical protein